MQFYVYKLSLSGPIFSLQDFVDGTSKELNALNRPEGTEEETEPAQV